MEKQDLQEDNMRQKILNDSPQNSGEFDSSNSQCIQLSPLEKLIDKVGGQGRYQFISFLIFASMWFAASWLLVGQSFFFDDDYTCFEIQGKEQCQQFICSISSQQRIKKIKSHSDSIIFQFDEYYICQLDYMKSVLQSMLFIGSLIGFFIFPYIADNWGRKLAIRLSWLICTSGVAIISFADSGNMIGVGYFLAGFGVNPAITLCFSFINQECLGKKRQYYGVGVQIFLAIGEGVIGFVFVSNLHWYEIGYIMLAMFIAINILFFYLVQSPKFLLKFKRHKTLKALNSIAKKNSKNALQEEDIINLHSHKESIEDGGASIVDLFKYKSLRMTTFATALVFLGIQIIYYSTSLNLDSVGDSKLVNQQIIAIAEGTSYIAAQLIISKAKRKKLTAIGMFISSLMCAFLAILIIFDTQNNHDIVVILQTVGLLVNRFVLCATWASFYVYIAELFPTRVRSLGLGWNSAVGTFGSAFAPYLTLLSQSIGINTWVIPGIFGFVAVGASFLLTETFGRPLKDQIDQIRDAQIFKRNQENQSSSSSQEQKTQTDKMQNID